MPAQLNPQQREAVDWQVLVTIAASFGVGTALEKSGAADAIAQSMVSLTGFLQPAWQPVAMISAIYLATMLLSELITNNAAAVLAFPFWIQAADAMGVDPKPFAMAVAIAASCAFATPIGYQTHMMVYGPGGYRFVDFVRVGLPLDPLMWIVASLAIPLAWTV